MAQCPPLSTPPPSPLYFPHVTQLVLSPCCGVQPFRSSIVSVFNPMIVPRPSIDAFPQFPPTLCLAPAQPGPPLFQNHVHSWPLKPCVHHSFIFDTTCGLRYGLHASLFKTDRFPPFLNPIKPILSTPGFLMQVGYFPILFQSPPEPTPRVHSHPKFSHSSLFLTLVDLFISVSYPRKCSPSFAKYLCLVPPPFPRSL